MQQPDRAIASILRHAGERGVGLLPVDEVDLRMLSAEAELDLLRLLASLSKQITGAAEHRAPHRLAYYAQDLAAAFHRFYTECRVLTDDEPLTQARLSLCAAVKQTIANTLALLGVSAPESMERESG